MIDSAQIWAGGRFDFLRRRFSRRSLSERFFRGGLSGGHSDHRERGSRSRHMPRTSRRRRSGCARSAARSSAAPPKRRAPPTDRTCTRRAAHLQNTAREQLLINTLHAGAQVFEYVRQHRTRASSTRASRVRAPRCARAAQPVFTSHCCCLLRRSTCLCVREGRHCCCRRTLRPAHSAHRVAPRSLIRHARR